MKPTLLMLPSKDGKKSVIPYNKDFGIFLLYQNSNFVILSPIAKTYMNVMEKSKKASYFTMLSLKHDC